MLYSLLKTLCTLLMEYTTVCNPHYVVVDSAIGVNILKYHEARKNVLLWIEPILRVLHNTI